MYGTCIYNIGRMFAAYDFDFFRISYKIEIFFIIYQIRLITPT